MILSRIAAAARRRLFADRPIVTATLPDARTIDLDDAEIAGDPFPHYDRLRSAGSVHYLARHDCWIVLGHDDVKRALGDAETFSSAPYADIDSVLLAADPPRQAEVRRLVSRRFASHGLAQLEATARDTASSLLAPQFDAVAGFAAPISRAVAARLIGLDAQAVSDIVEGTRETVAAPAPLDALTAMLDRIAPRATIFAELAADGKGVIEDAQVRSLVRLLWLAATTTTERVIARCVLRLAETPALAARIATDTALLAPFIEEVMRLHPPEHLLPRSTTRAVEIGGVVIPAGALVQVCVASANRDPGHFERPGELRLDRPEKRHFAFGSGVHHCLGAPLSRHVVAASLATLLDASTSIRLRVAVRDLPFFRTASALSPLELPITL